jgi:hypothetical protein
MLLKNNVALAPPLIHLGSKEVVESGLHGEAILNKSSVYSDNDPSLKATVYMFGESYVGIPTILATGGGEWV